MTNLIEKNKHFNKRWNIDGSTNYELEFNKFKTRILNIFSDIDDKLTDNSVLRFCNFFGIPISDFGNNIINALSSENDEKNFYKMLEIIFCLGFEGEGPYERFKPEYKQSLLPPFIEAVRISNINLEVAIDGNDLILYPRGEKLLDEILVNKVLSFLDGSSYNHFVDALKFYDKAQPKYYIKASESLRRTVEEFLRLKLENDHGLDKNITFLQSRLKEDKRDIEIRKIIFSIFSYLDKYFNENSKHKDGDINSSECEFLIYETGLLLRYINHNF